MKNFLAAATLLLASSPAWSIPVYFNEINVNESNGTVRFEIAAPVGHSFDNPGPNNATSDWRVEVIRADGTVANIIQLRTNSPGNPVGAGMTRYGFVNRGFNDAVFATGGISQGIVGLRLMNGATEIQFLSTSPSAVNPNIAGATFVGNHGPNGQSIQLQGTTFDGQNDSSSDPRNTLSWVTASTSFGNAPFGSVNANQVYVTPAPPALWLLGTALMGLFGLSRRRKSAANINAVPVAA